MHTKNQSVILEFFSMQNYSLIIKDTYFANNI